LPKGSQLFGVVGASSELQDARNVAADYNADYPHIFYPYGLPFNETIPTTVFVDSTGKILSVLVGARSGAAYRAELVRLLALTAAAYTPSPCRVR
jgi:hypothetical protein